MRKTCLRNDRAFLILCAFIIMFITNLVLAEDSIEQAVKEIEPESKSSDKITLDVKGVDVNELFKVLSTKSRITIITSPAVQGRVTVFMDNLSFPEAIDVIVTMQDLAYERKANVVKVMTAAEYEKAYGKKFAENKQTRTFKLAYAKPANVLAMINSLKSDVGKIISDEASGTIIIKDSPQSIEIMADAIKELDQPLETLVFNVNYARFADLKGYLNDLITPGVGQIIVDERSSKVFVSDFPQRLVRIKKLMEEFDEQSRQVLITGEIIEIVIDDKYQGGIEWDKIFKSINMDDLEFVGKFPVSPALSSYGKISVGTMTRDHYNLVMNMLSEYGDTKIINRPRIVAVNKEEAKILVGTREAYVTSAQSQAETTTITAESVQFIDVGVKLTVVPTIGSDGFVTMKIKPEVSTVTDTLTTESGTRVPIVSTSQSESVVKVKDGSTLIIAGLLKQENIEDTSGLPKLSRMPILGNLFATKAKEKKRTELVIFITPTIITETNNFAREEKNEKK